VAYDNLIDRFGAKALVLGDSNRKITRTCFSTSHGEVEKHRVTVTPVPNQLEASDAK
jgi:hypothetical protein